MADAFVGVTAAQVLLSDPPSVKLAYLDHTSEIDVAGIVFTIREEQNDIPAGGVIRFPELI